jgi:hypothetical protein
MWSMNIVMSAKPRQKSTAFGSRGIGEILHDSDAGGGLHCQGGAGRCDTPSHDRVSNAAAPMFEIGRLRRKMVRCVTVSTKVALT